MNSPSAHPTGTVTLVHTDIEGSSQMSLRYGEAFERARSEHYRLLREAYARWNGYEVDTAGDALFMVFARASDALQWAVEAQRALASHTWPEPVESLRIRIGMHTGEPFVGEDNGRPTYRGPATNKAARVQGVGHGGQILLSDATYSIVQNGLPPGIDFLDCGPHRLKDVGEEHLWQVTHKELQLEFPPLKSLNPIRHNLPVPLTPFIGRKKEVEQWRAMLLKPETRLLTLLGFSGMGKTRTALELAELCYPDFEDGVWWIELENATTGEEMIGRIAEQLRISLKPQPSVREQVWDFHRDRSLLLVLDNVEQIAFDDAQRTDEAAEVVLGLLNAGPRVKCLVTSQRSLNLAVQQLVELPPLQLTEAETLFVERARARKPGFTVNPANATDIAAICDILEGLPLAIEIAASLINLMTPRQIRRELGDMLTVLETDDPGVPRRHLALRSAIDSSFSLLSEQAKALLIQVAVFHGGFNFDAVRRVCKVPHAASAIRTLRAHALLRGETDSTTQTERLSMLDSVRGYALEKSADDSVRRRHAEYYCEWAETQIDRLRTPEEGEALRELQLEFDNLRTALNWSETNDAALCARLALAFHEPLYYSPESSHEGGRGLWAEAEASLSRGLAKVLDLGEEGKPLRASLLFHLACLLSDMGQSSTALATANEALALSEELGDRLGQAETCNFLGLLATDGDRLDDAEELLKRALELFPNGAHLGRAKTLHNQARLAARRGQAEIAWELYDASLAERRASGDRRGEAVTLGNMGALAHNQGDLERAREFALHSLQLRRSLRDALGIAILLNNLADLALEKDEPFHAMVMYINAERMFRDLRSPYTDVPQASMKRLAAKFEAENRAAEFETLLGEAGRRAWEDLVPAKESRA